MADETTPAPAKLKERSPTFPFISLAQALSRAKQLYDAEKRAAVPLPIVAKHWKYSEASSGLAQTIGALKGYGLLSDEGIGPARRLRITDAALRILLDAREDSKERIAYLRKAALAPAVAAEIYTRHPDGLPSEAVLSHELIFDLGFNEETAKKAARIILENESLTKYSESALESRPSDIPSDVGGGDIVDNLLNSSAGKSLPAPMQRIVERIRGPGGEILVQTEGEPTWEDYDFLEKYIALRKSVLKPKD